MSDIKIQPSGSGTAVVTLTAPTTNTARTITFPDATGTLINTGSDLPAAQLTGTVADARISALTASKLTGALPAISGASLTNLPADSTKLPLAGGTMTGTIAGFTSTGIDDNADATCLTIDSSENITHNSATPKFTIKGTAGEYGLYFKQGNTEYSSLTWNVNTGETKLSNGQNGTGNYLTFAAGNGSERMRIDSNGVVMVGMTSKTETVSTQAAAYFAPTGSSNEYATLFIVHNSAQKHGIVLKDMNNGGTQLDFRKADGTQVGSIYTSSSATTYATSSDYRLKENVDYTWDATTRLKQLKPARFNFIVDDTNTLVDGFIAHEVSSVVPEAITGTKDGMTATILYTAEDEETQGDSPTKSVGDVKEASKPDHQGIDQSKLVPLLVKTIQELEARITALE